jgi:hypothetical protein
MFFVIIGPGLEISTKCCMDDPPQFRVGKSNGGKNKSIRQSGGKLWPGEISASGMRVVFEMPPAGDPGGILSHRAKTVRESIYLCEQVSGAEFSTDLAVTLHDCSS